MKHKGILFFIVLLVGLAVNCNAIPNSVKIDGLTGAPNEDYVSVGDLTAGVSTTYTAEAWIKPAQLTGGAVDHTTYGYTIMSSSTVVGGYPLWLTAKGTELNVWSFTNTAPVAHTTSGAGLTVGNWYHVAITSVKGGLTKIYVNGVQKLSYTNENQGNWNSVFTIGVLRSSRAVSLIPFHGLIDEVRVWNVVRTQSEIQASMYNEIPTPVPAALKGYWRFNETTGTNAPDLASVAHNGTLMNGASWNSPSGGAPLNPVIYATGTFNAFSTTVGTPSASQYVAVSGTTLNSNINVAAVTGFEYSTTNAAPWTTTLSLSPSFSGNVYVRLDGTTIGSYSGNIAFTSTGASQVNKSVSGSVNYIPPSVPTVIETGVSVDITNTVTGGLYYLTGIVPPAVSNPSFTLGTAFSLTGTGTVMFNVTTAYTWGAYYQGGVWFSSAAVTGVIPFTIDFDVAKGTIPVILGSGADPTLPVELSIFTALTTAEHFVGLHWVTQSETNVSGYYVYRNTENSIDTAIRVSPFIPALNLSTQSEYSFVDEEVLPNTRYYFWLQNIDLTGDVALHGPVTIYVDNNGSVVTPPIPIVDGLQSIYPNPFNPRTTISYSLTKATVVEISIYNSRGQLVRSFDEGQKAAGLWKVQWNGMDNAGNACTTGAYYIRMQAGNDSYLRKAVMIK
ncbi:MAG: hypothetical protein CVU48_07610 [Candidatus Cloacimonetes bacterium HGW-Cloacimonetes-1]|jgi:hypothetical protein|nr:MAG: hypothetical protein CVU48_07610 [Candidatus Cloacimonetes bacterium HGW-Cloacimonetes-1]